MYTVWKKTFFFLENYYESFHVARHGKLVFWPKLLRIYFLCLLGLTLSPCKKLLKNISTRNKTDDVNIQKEQKEVFS